MASLDEMEGDAVLGVVLVIVGIVLFSLWTRVKGGAGGSVISTGATAAGSAAASAVTGAAQGAGNTVGDWLWGLAVALFPSLGDTSAYPLNPSPAALAAYQKQMSLLGGQQQQSQMPVDPGFPNVPVDPSFPSIIPQSGGQAQNWYNPPTLPGFPDVPVNPNFGG